MSRRIAGPPQTPIRMTKFSNASQRFPRFPLVKAHLTVEIRVELCHTLQHIRRGLARLIQPVPEMGHSDVADRQKRPRGSLT